jgi:hypothetical protein
MNLATALHIAAGKLHDALREDDDIRGGKTPFDLCREALAILDEALLDEPTTPSPDLIAAPSTLAEEIEFLEGVAAQPLWNGRARDHFRSIIAALRSDREPVTRIKSFPSRAVEEFRKSHNGALPSDFTVLADELEQMLASDTSTLSAHLPSKKWEQIIMALRSI